MKRRRVALIAVQLACERSARTAIHKLGRGIPSLNAIAITAPMLGSLAMFEGTRLSICVRIIEVNRGHPGNLFAEWPENFIPLAFSLPVAALALTIHRLLLASLANLRAETETAILQLLNDLVRPRSAPLS